jgi:hypothetical protein
VRRSLGGESGSTTEQHAGWHDLSVEAPVAGTSIWSSSPALAPAASSEARRSERLTRPATCRG